MQSLEVLIEDSTEKLCTPKYFNIYPMKNGRIVGRFGLIILILASCTSKVIPPKVKATESHSFPGCSETIEACAIATINHHTQKLNNESLKFLTQRMLDPVRHKGVTGQAEMDFCNQIDSMEASAITILSAVRALKGIDMKDITGTSIPCEASR